jgi:hypothetical protein
MSGSPKLIQPGNPPLIWSNVEQAFRNINQNFNDLYATIQADGSTQVVNFSSLFDDVSPGVTDIYSLGADAFRWKRMYVSPYAPTPDGEDNGVWLGNAQIRGISDTVDLPLGSTVNGDLIIDPNKTFFKGAQVDSGNQVVADEFVDTLNLNSGTAMQLVVDSAAESITFNNTGVTQATAGAGISVNSATGNVTITNSGVTTVTNSAGLPTGRSAGAGIASTSTTGSITLTNTGILDVQGGFGITVSVDPATGIANVVNTAPAQVAFRTVVVDGQTDIVADSTADTLTVEAGYGTIITTNATTDTVSIAVDQNIDITGSVFADNSTLLVDAVDGVIRGPIDTTGVLDGELIGSVFGDDSTKLVDAVESKIVGNVDTSVVETNLIISQGGNLNATGSNLVIGAANGTSNGGTIIIGGGVGTSGNGGVVNIGGGLGSAGDGGNLILGGGNGSAGDGGRTSLLGGTGSINGGDVYIYAGSGGSGTAGSVFLEGLVNLTNANIVGLKADLAGSVFGDDSTLLVNAVDNTLSASSFTGNIFTSTIDSSDSSEITVVPAARFNSNVTVDNDLIVGNIPGYISLTTLKAEVAASTSFADFQSRIAAL